MPTPEQIKIAEETVKLIKTWYVTDNQQNVDVIAFAIAKAQAEAAQSVLSELTDAAFGIGNYRGKLDPLWTGTTGEIVVACKKHLLNAARSAADEFTKESNNN